MHLNSLNFQHSDPYVYSADFLQEEEKNWLLKQLQVNQQ